MTSRDLGATRVADHAGASVDRTMTGARVRRSQRRSLSALTKSAGLIDFRHSGGHPVEDDRVALAARSEVDQLGSQLARLKSGEFGGEQYCLRLAQSRLLLVRSGVCSLTDETPALPMSRSATGPQPSVLRLLTSKRPQRRQNRSRRQRSDAPARPARRTDRPCDRGRRGPSRRAPAAAGRARHDEGPVEICCRRDIPVIRSQRLASSSPSVSPRLRARRLDQGLGLTRPGVPARAGGARRDFAFL